MKLSLRNLAMGAALAVSSLAFAQEMPFTITETFSTVLTKANGGIDAANIRGGVAFNNAVYMLDKSTGTIYKWDAEGKTEYRTGLNTSALSPSITVDYAGNILVSYGWSGALTGFGIVPADGSDVIYINELPTIENWAPGRTDVLGRVAGDMLSEEGAYLFLPGTGSAYCAYYYFSNGEIFAPESGYASSAYSISCSNLDVAVPAASTVAEIEELDPLYDAAYIFPWNTNAQYIDSEECQTLGRPADLSYSAVPGGDLFTFEGKTYFVSPYTQVATKRTGDFVIFDEELNIVYKSQTADPDTTAVGAFPNSGSIIVRPIDDYTFELGVAGGTATGFFCSTYTIAFPKPEPELPFTITETFSTVLTKANGGIDAANIRGGVAFNNAVYMLDKSTGTIYKWDAEGKTEYRTGLNTSALSPSITVDYAGNILVSYGWSGALTGFGIVPADGSDVIYINELPTIENWAPGRKDVLGRVAGDMLSEEGAYLFLPGTGSAYCAYYYFSNGEIFAPESGYASSAYSISCSNLDVAVPAASTIAEIEELDPLYDAAYIFPWNTSAQYIDNEECQTLGRPADLSYSAVPGGDLFTFEGKTYFVSPYTQVATKRTGDFVIFDEELNIVYKSQTADPDTTAVGAFPNSGSIIVRPIDDYTFELGVAGGTATGFFCSTYTIAFPKPEVQHENLYLIGDFNNWDLTAMEELVPVDGKYTYTFTEKAENGFKISTGKDNWDAIDAGVLGVVDQPNTYVLEVGTPVALVAGKTGNIAAPSAGNWTITIDEATKEITLSGESTEPAKLVVSKKWWFEGLAGPGKAEARFGTGFDGKIYTTDKANQKVVAIDKTGAITDYATVEGIGVGITSDDAGNILVNTNFPNAGSCTDFVIIAPDGTQTPLTLTMPDGITAARVDQIGRVVGNLLSEEGAFFYIGANGATSIALIQVKNGVQVTDELSFYATESFSAPTINTSTIIQPMLSFDEMVELGDDALNAYAIRNRSSMNVYYYDGETNTNMGAVAGANSQEGFDVFNLGGVQYQVVPIKGKSGVNYSSEFAIADSEGNIVYIDEMDGGDASQSFGSFTARTISDTMVELYYFMSSGKGITAAKYVITLGEPEPDANAGHIYLLGAPTNWTEPVEANAAFYEDFKLIETEEGSNVYTGKFNIANGLGQFRFIPELNGWDSPQFGAQEADSLVDVHFTNAAFQGNLVAGKGSFKFTNFIGGEIEMIVNLQTKVVILNTTADALFPELAVRGAFDEWGAGYKMSTPVAADIDGNLVYTVTIANLPEGELKIGQPDSWTYNFGAAEAGVELKNGTATAAQYNGFNYQFAGAENVTVTLTANLDYSITSYITITWIADGVEDVAVEAAEAVYYNLNGIRVAAEDLTPGFYVKVVGTTATKVVVK